MGSKELMAAFCVSFLFMGTAQGQEIATVGALGHRDRLAVEGAKTFSSDEIRAAVLNELDVIAACAPADPLKAFIDVVDAKVTAGYREAGFFDVDLTVAAADDKLVLTIKEGQRFTNGEIKVVGNRQVDAEKIKARLIHADTEGPKPRRMWPVDEPASFTPEAETRLKEEVLSFLYDQGCYRAKLSAKIEPDRDAQRAWLRIDLTDEGPLTTLADVVMKGNQRDCRDAVIAYLGLEGAAPLTRDLREQIERKLLASGRFISVRWELGEPKSRGDYWRPRLALEEFDSAPPLSQRLSREEAALLKVAEWFQRLERSQEELVLEDTTSDNVLVFAPQRGFIALVRPWSDDAKPDGAPRFDYAIVMNEERVGLYSRPQHQKIVAEPPPSPVIGEAGLTIVDGAPEWTGDDKLTFGAGFNTRGQKGYRRHVKLSFELTATAALSLLYKHNAKPHWDGDILSLAWGNRELRMNAITGQFIEQVVKYDKGAGEQDAVSVRLVVMPGEFERRRREIDDATADWPNMANARRPLSCLAEFLCPVMEQQLAYYLRHVDDARVSLGDDKDDPRIAAMMKDLERDVDMKMRESYARQQRGYAAFRKAISSGMLTPFDRLLCEMNKAPRDRFSIPQRTFHFHFRSFDELGPLVRELAPLIGVRVGNYLFPDQSWMNEAWRKGLLALAGKRTALLNFGPGDFTEESGPLKSFATAELLSAAGEERCATMDAFEARRRWSRGAALPDECRELVSGKGFATEVLLATAGTMRKLQADDIGALCQLLVELDLLDEQQAALLEFAGLKAQTEESPEEAAASALDAIWRAGLANWAQRRLDDLTKVPEDRRHDTTQRKERRKIAPR